MNQFSTGNGAKTFSCQSILAVKLVFEHVIFYLFLIKGTTLFLSIDRLIAASLVDQAHQPMDMRKNLFINDQLFKLISLDPSLHFLLILIYQQT